MKKRINITLEEDVITRVDRYAKERYTSRSGAITRLIVEATNGETGYSAPGTGSTAKTRK